MRNKKKYDITPSEFIIEDANIIDGTGAEAYLADLHVKDGLILRISQGLRSENPRIKIYSASGLILSPGFIDAHGHSDLSIIAAPEAEGKISQGITTEICGNCGLSVFPLTEHNREHIEEIYKNYNIPLDWSDVVGYEKILNSARPAINIASLCGHNTLRASLSGYEKKSISSSELSEMKSLLSRELKNGAIGFSTGLLYVPGRFSEFNELFELLRVLAKFAKVYSTHLRSEGDRFIEALEEAIILAKKAGVPRLEISHLKTAGRLNWHKLDEALQMIEFNSDDNLKISADRYPYIESMTNLSAYLPSPFCEMDDIKISKYLTEANGKKEAIHILSMLDPEFWGTMRLVNTSLENYAKYQGMNFAKIAEKTGSNPAQLCLEILSDAPSAIVAGTGMSEENMRRIISLPFVACGSDESSRNRDYRLGRSHPRGFGSFPRFIRLALTKMPLHKIIKKITSNPAKLFSLKGRGLIKEGYYADMVLFDPEKLEDIANFATPHKLSKGIEKVWVNGALSWDSKDFTLARAGIFLR